MEYEENPFQDPIVAQEWIGSVEGEQGMFRDSVVYPLLEKWTEEVNPEFIVEIGSGQGVCSKSVGQARYGMKWGQPPFFDNNRGIIFLVCPARPESMSEIKSTM